MAIIVASGDTGDGALASDAWKDEGGVNANPDFQTDARAGNNAAIDPDGDPLSGQKLAIGGQMWGGIKQCSRNEGFIAFRPATGFQVPVGVGEVELVNSSVRHGRYGKFHDGNSTFGGDDSIRWYIRDWSAPVTTSAWYDLNALTGDNSPDFETKNWIKDGADDLYEVSARRQYADIVAALEAKQAVAYMMTLTTATQNYPKDGNWIGYIPSANHTLLPSHFRPYAILKFVRRHALNHVLGASIQLTDGTAVFLRYDDANERVGLNYQKVGQTSPTLIANLKSKTATHDNSSGATHYFGIEPGNQTLSITRDDANNIYIAGSRGNEQAVEYDTQFYNVQCFKYTGNGVTHSWTEVAQGTSGSNTAIPASDVHRGQPNNFAIVWLPQSQGGNLGQVATLFSRRDGQWARYQMGISTEYAGYWQGISGAQQLHGIRWAGNDADTGSWWRPWNSAGSGMDAFRDGNTVRFATFTQALNNWGDGRSNAGRTLVSTTGTPDPLVFPATSLSPNTPHDPDGKVRAVWLGENSPYYGIARHGHIQLLRKTDDSIFKQIDLPSSGISGFPSRTDLWKSAAWDLIWVNGQDRIAVYYKDTNNARKLRRVFWDYNTGNISASEDFTPTALGDSGSDIIAIRLPRQQTDTRCLIIDVAMQDGGGAPLGLVVIRDTSLDVPPQAPTILPIDQFNASGTKAIEWVFNDGNPLDFPTYQDIEVRNLTTGVTAHFVNHVTAVVVDAATRTYRYTIGSSVLSNDTQYQIRIRSYDSVDVAGDWSLWTNFATTATGGVVQILEPATDLEPLNRASVTVKWSYSNSDVDITQTGYRVRVYNDDTGVLFSDSGAVSSLATEYTITSLVSDVRYRIEVTITDSATQTSGAGTRLVFPDFNNPSIPEVVLSPQPGYIEVRVTNPPPVGDNPVTLKNQIARRETEQPTELFVVIGECEPNGVFSDYTVASGVEYVYKARGQS